MANAVSTVRRLGEGATAAVSGSAPHLAAAAVLFFAVPQLYLLPEGTSDIAFTTILTAALLPGLLLTIWRTPGIEVLRTALFWVLVCLVAVRVVALAWSPEPSAGLQPVVLLGQFVILLVLMSVAARRDRHLLRRLQPVYWPWVAAEAVLVVVFRLLPDVEDAFLRSVAGFAAGHNTMAAMFSDGRNNVFDVAKSGGVFVNANVAAMFLGVNGLAAIAMSVLTRTRWVRVLGVALLAVVPATGSKSATILVVALLLGALGIFLTNRVVRPAVRRYLPLAACSVAMVVVVVLSTVGRGFLHAATEAFAGRTVIWRFGAESFRHKPVLGLGYGGWDAGFPPYAAQRGLDQDFPPHNVFLAAWSNTGLPGLALSVAFFAVAFWLVGRRLSASSGRPRLFAGLAGAAIAWVLLQGMGENTDIFGEIHLTPVFALLIACLVTPVGEETDSVRQADRWHSATPAVPAVGDVHQRPGVGAAGVPATVRREGPGPDVAGRPVG
jgi:hypothetical protein